MWISAIVTAANLLLSLLVGLRLLCRFRPRKDAPEVWLAGYFLLAACLGAGSTLAVYGDLAGMGPGLSDRLTRGVLAFSTFSTAAGATCLVLFTWRTFRRHEPWAEALMALVSLLLFGGFFGQVALEGFAVAVLPGALYWVGKAGVLLALAWICAESFRYRRMLRRRLALGLADPVVTNRFLLLGLWSGTWVVTSFSDVVARLVYVWITGETARLLIEEVRPIVVTTVAITSLMGAVSACTLLLAFFPTAGYRRWLESRAVSPRAAA